MDPQASWDHLLCALAEEDWDLVEDLAEGLLRWLDRGGFPPMVIGNPRLGADWQESLCRAGCVFALDLVQARWTTANSLPPLEKDHAR